jgi:hypothetical protein
MSAIPIYTQYHEQSIKNKQYKLPNHPYSYIKMLIWIFGIYKQ